MAGPSNAPEPKMDSQDLYREDMYTDRRVGTIRVMTPVKPDGTTWAGGSSSHVDPNSLRKDVVEYNPTKFEFFGGISRGGSIVFIRKDKLESDARPEAP